MFAKRILNKMDLSLIPLEDIVKELENRHVAYILAVLRIDTGNEPIINTYWKENKFIDCLGMCSALEEDLKEHYMRKGEPK